MSRSEVVTEALAVSVEPSLVARDTTSAQAVIDKVLSVRDVKWAYITAPNGEVLFDTFVPHFPSELKRNLPMVNDYAWTRLAGERVPTLVIRRKVLRGVVGTVWVGFNQTNLLSSIRGMERTILSRIILVMLIVTFLFCRSDPAHHGSHSLPDAGGAVAPRKRGENLSSPASGIPR